MKKLPFIQPKKEFYLNVAVLLLVLNKLFETSRGKKNLNIDRIQTFYFLVNNPQILNKVLAHFNKKQIEIDVTDYYTVEKIFLDVSDLYDKKKLAVLIRFITLKGYVAVDFTKEDGFVFCLNSSGEDIVESLNSSYFKKITFFTEAALTLRSKNLSSINTFINSLIR
ncbi:ABC-three component system middle component 4 [uncultured Acinetobacter sp.]|uniref:ABC-three component system middle component 4 n=1 Tax=uncultured Acinetobacter sp. TaxID=165433 RepID=UPI0025888795|nr:ABC-three component system middle component 4 [uncultured Acinetobacter sp.]